jgi:RNA 2',3'-cyclic 3'-phosphodiesterase
VRTFVALNLPAADREQLHASVEPLARSDLPIRWIAADALHLTIKFLGEIEGGIEVTRIGDALRAVAARHASVSLDMRGLGAFPSLRRASVLWIGIAPDAALMSLQRDVEIALSRAGYPREQKPYRPHITVGRTRGGARPPDVGRLVGTHDWSGTVRVETIDLMRSHTQPDGARYEPLLRIPLGPQAAA